MRLLKGIISVGLLASLSMAAEYVIKFSHVVAADTPKGKAAVLLFILEKGLKSLVTVK